MLRTEAEALGYLKSKLRIAKPTSAYRMRCLMYELKLKRIWHTQLPHWEVERGIYFITIRCTNSLPSEVKRRIQEIQISLAETSSDHSDFQQLQRQYFLCLEKYQDRGLGFTPFLDEACCERALSSFKALENLGWHIEHNALMPNHVHLVVRSEEAADMAKTWSEWKGRLAFECNRVLNRQGSFWQNDWFDHVCRNENETARVVSYVLNNPIKAKLGRNYKWVG